MNLHRHVPDAEVSTEELERRQKRRGKWIAVGVVYILTVSTAAAAFGIIDFRSQTNHHASSSAQQATIKAQGKTIISQGTTEIRLQHDNHNLGMSNHKLSLKIQNDAAALAHDGQSLAAEFGLICVSLHISSPLCTP